MLAAVADAEGEAPIMVFDYLQGYARRIEAGDRRLAVGALSDTLNSWARDARSTALVLSSVGRGYYHGNEERGATDFLGAGKEAGEIEFDARGLLFLDSDPCPIDGEAAARLHIAKHAFGGEGATIGLRFKGAMGTFREDPEAALSEDQRAMLDAIRGGAVTVEALATDLGKRRQEVARIVALLMARGVVSRLTSRSPLRAVDVLP